jgi:transcriptional antiterminator Rof (Rho-off)
MSDKYIPIHCEFLERLQYWCLKKISCNIVYRQGNFPRDLEIDGIIKDITSKDNAEFMTLENETEIRLDRIVSVNSYELPKNSCRIG